MFFLKEKIKVELPPNYEAKRKAFYEYLIKNGMLKHIIKEKK